MGSVSRQSLVPDFVLIARTDARGAVGGGLDEAIRRANAYLAAGADIAFVEAWPRRRRFTGWSGRSRDRCSTTRRASRRGSRPRGFASSGWRWPSSRARYLASASRRWPTSRRSSGGGPGVEAELTERTHVHPYGSLHEFAGFGQIRRWEEEFLLAEHLGKYAPTLGHQPGRADASPDADRSGGSGAP